MKYSHPIFHNYVSPLYCKRLTVAAVPHHTASFWLWRPSTDEVKLRCYFFDAENVLEQQDANLMAIDTDWRRIAAFTIGDMLPYIGTHILTHRNGEYFLNCKYNINAFAPRMADAYAEALLKMISFRYITIQDLLYDKAINH